jgi:hypothetical protein
MRLSNDKLQLINRLPQTQRARIKRIVCTYISTCRRNGCEMDNLERVCLEAVEVVLREDGRWNQLLAGRSGLKGRPDNEQTTQ